MKKTVMSPEPMLLDMVQHKASKVYGEVRAKYKEGKKTYLDVLVSGKMHWHNNMNNWTIIRAFKNSRE